MKNNSTIQKILDRDLTPQDYLELLKMLKAAAEKMENEIKDPRHRR